MSPPARQLVAALQALTVRSATRYAWLGQDFDVAAPGRPQLSWDLAVSLQARLYSDFYLTGAPSPASAPRSWRAGPARRDAIDVLSAANRGAGCTEPGWTVRRREGGTVVVERDGLEVRASADEVIPLSAGTDPGALVALRLPKERRGRWDGFYTALGDAGSGGDGPVDRFYWNIRGDAAAALLTAASEILNGARLPFRLKTVNPPTLARCDAAVLYTPRDSRRDAVALVAHLHRRISHGLRPGVPALALRLAPGLAFAEDPGVGESFGSHRCRLIAEAAYASWRAGDRGTPARIGRVRERLAREGIALDRIHLGPGAQDDPASWAVIA